MSLPGKQGHGQERADVGQGIEDDDVLVNPENQVFFAVGNHAF